ncbi:unnamed protein product [Diabrotica balteata]|uniref:Beta-glucuronidase n=1 Tax=Diabrotica balteata TaxID=107213 RepID=A0A9N9T0B0_DIABA|nr:unnamed protein product [Diabrotica balteata]
MIIIWFLFFTIYHGINGGILYPRLSKTRDLLSLDGIWRFSLVINGSVDYSGGLSNLPEDKDLHLMPVPSSFNDIPTTTTARDHYGPVYYERIFEIPSSWKGKRIWLRFGSVCYSAQVYLNDEAILSHEIGHLPFQTEVTQYIEDDQENNMRVIVDTTLTNTTIPQGSATVLPGNGRVIQSVPFDFFNYGGIDRPVILYTTPLIYIDDITITTRVKGTTGIVQYTVDLGGTKNKVGTRVTVLDKDKKAIISSDSLNGQIEITDANLWWPFLMHNDTGYLYSLKVELFDGKQLLDTYTQSFGIRELVWNSTSFTINGKPVYFRGFGRHEDSDIRGKGLDLPLILRDHNLIRWIGANSYRTSHYPYAEEIMDLADSLGIMIVDEVPAVALSNFNDGLLGNHLKALTEIYNRDKNRPSVVIWSIANEPSSQEASSKDYFRQVANHMRSLDTTRPLTIAHAQQPDVDHTGEFLDILCFNIYTAWYEYPGEVDAIIPEVQRRAKAWHTKHNKPVMVTEYGADTLAGLHTLPEFVWSEEYQVKFMAQYFDAYDKLRAEGWFIGEMIWNFADFSTPPKYFRVDGNKKGIFTRQRQPKNSAHLLRRRYWYLAYLLDGATEYSAINKTFIGL